MSAFSLDTDKSAPAARRSQARRLIWGPALVLALALGSSGALAAALVLATILEY